MVVHSKTHLNTTIVSVQVTETIYFRRPENNLNTTIVSVQEDLQEYAANPLLFKYNHCVGSRSSKEPTQEEYS